MNTFGTRSIKVAAVLATAAGAVIGGVAHTSAEAPSQWLYATDGCYYLSYDGGQTATEAACPTGNGYINVYVADSGQWYFSQTVVADGGVVQQSPVQIGTSMSLITGTAPGPVISHPPIWDAQTILFDSSMQLNIVEASESVLG